MIRRKILKNRERPSVHVEHNTALDTIKLMTIRPEMVDEITISFTQLRELIKEFHVQAGEDAQFEAVILLARGRKKLKNRK